MSTVVLQVHDVPRELFDSIPGDHPWHYPENGNPELQFWTRTLELPGITIDLYCKEPAVAS